MSTVARRLTGSFGLVFVVALAASLATAAGAPGTDTPASAVELYVQHHYHSLQVSVALAAVAVLFLCLFAGGVATHLRRADEATGDPWAPAFIVGAAGTAALLTASVAAQGAYQELSHVGAVPDQVHELFLLSNGMLAAAGLFVAVALAAAGTSGVLNGSIPAPLSWLGLLTALVGLVGAGGLGTTRNVFGTLDLITLILLEVWSLGVSVWLVTGPEPGRAQE